MVLTRSAPRRSSLLPISSSMTWRSQARFSPSLLLKWWMTSAGLTLAATATERILVLATPWRPNCSMAALRMRALAVRSFSPPCRSPEGTEHMRSILNKRSAFGQVQLHRAQLHRHVTRVLLNRESMLHYVAKLKFRCYGDDPFTAISRRVAGAVVLASCFALLHLPRPLEHVARGRLGRVHAVGAAQQRESSGLVVAGGRRRSQVRTPPRYLGSLP